MAKRKKKRRGKRKIPLAATAGAVGALLPIIQVAMSGNFAEAGNTLVRGFTGFDPASGFNPAHLAGGLIPMILGAGVSMLASKSGINRYVQIPMIKI